MSQFLGEYEVPVDDKGRVFIPAELRRKLVPEAGDTFIIVRGLVGCLTACERYFEQRTRLGEGRVPNGDLAQDQWDGILAAADALDALARAGDDPPVVVGEAQTAP